MAGGDHSHTALHPVKELQEQRVLGALRGDVCWSQQRACPFLLPFPGGSRSSGPGSLPLPRTAARGTSFRGGIPWKQTQPLELSRGNAACAHCTRSNPVLRTSWVAAKLSEAAGDAHVCPDPMPECSRPCLGPRGSCCLLSPQCCHAGF